MVEHNQMGILMVSCPESKGLRRDWGRPVQARLSRSEALDGPVFQNQAGNAAEVTGVSGDEGTTILQDNRRDSQIHPADIQPQAKQLFVSRDGYGRERQNHPLGHEGNRNCQPLVHPHQVIWTSSFPEPSVPAGELLLHADDRDG